MKWMVIAGVVLVLVVLVPTLIGAMLPEKHVAARSIWIRQKPDAVWALVADFARAPEWRKGVKSVELLSPNAGRVRFREKSSNGTLTFEVEEFDPPRRMATRIVGREEGFGGRWLYSLAPERDGTRVTITEEGEIYNPIFRFISRFFIGYTGTLDGYLSSLARRFGDTSAPEAVRPTVANAG